MNSKIIKHRENCRKAILLFLGWGMDERPFQSIRSNGYDMVLVWNYSNDDFDISQLSQYSEIVVIGWSFGVFNAQRFIERYSDSIVRPSLKIAVNGTLYPIDPEKGISPTIFEGTLNNLSEKSLAKFQLRMCGSRQVFNYFLENSPNRDIDSLRTELKRIGDLKYSIADFETVEKSWDYVIIGTRDMIFTPEAQRYGWSLNSNVIETDLPHYVDLQAIIDSYVFDKQLVAHKFQQSLRTYAEKAIVQKRMASKLANMIPSERCYVNALEIGTGCGNLVEELKTRLTIGKLSMWDLSVGYEGVCVCDAEESIRFEKNSTFDLIASSSAIQWFNSPKTFVDECFRVAKKGAILALSTFGEKNFQEIGNVSAVSLRYGTLEKWENMVSECGWDILDSRETISTLEFDSPIDVLRHIRQTGVNGISLSGKNVSAAKTLLSHYPIVNNKSPLTYHSIFIVAEKK